VQALHELPAGDTHATTLVATAVAMQASLRCNGCDKIKQNKKS
jgi:hypothetical protein